MRSIARKQIRRPNRNRQGAVVVEAAIMLPFLIIVTFGAIDVSQYINTGQTIANASREGARVAARNDTDSVSDIEDAIMNYLADVMPQLNENTLESAVTISVQRVTLSTDDDGSTITTFSNIPGGELAAVGSGNAISIDVQFDFDTIRWLGGPGYADPSIRTVCRRE